MEGKKQGCSPATCPQPLFSHPQHVGNWWGFGVGLHTLFTHLGLVYTLYPHQKIWQVTCNSNMHKGNDSSIDCWLYAKSYSKTQKVVSRGWRWVSHWIWEVQTELPRLTRKSGSLNHRTVVGGVIINPKLSTTCPTAVPLPGLWIGLKIVFMSKRSHKWNIY